MAHKTGWSTEYSRIGKRWNLAAAPVKVLALNKVYTELWLEGKKVPKELRERIATKLSASKGSNKWIFKMSGWVKIEIVHQAEIDGNTGI